MYQEYGLSIYDWIAVFVAGGALIVAMLCMAIYLVPDLGEPHEDDSLKSITFDGPHGVVDIRGTLCDCLGDADGLCERCQQLSAKHIDEKV